MTKRSLILSSIIIACFFGAVTFYYISREKINDVLATVNGQEIRANEYLARYKEYLKVSSIHDNMATRHIILQDMIAEILMRSDSHARNWDTGPEYQHEVDKDRMQVLLDTYTQRAVVDSVKISDEEIKSAFARSNTKVSVRHLYAPSEEEALKLKYLLEHGETFESLAKKVFHDPHLANNGGYLGYIGWSDTDPNFEDAAYTLPVGKISDPVRTEQGYSILRVEKRVTAPLASEFDYQQNKKRITMALRANKIVAEGRKFTLGLVNEKDLSFNNEALDQVLKNWKKIESYQPIDLYNDSVKTFADITNNTFLNYPGGTWTIGDFLKKMSFTSETPRSRVSTIEDVRQFALGLYTRDAILERTKQAGYLDDPAVKDGIQKRVDYFLFTKWRNAASDSVEYQDTPPSNLNEADLQAWNIRHAKQEKKIREIYDSHVEVYRYPEEIRVKEIFVLSSTEAMSLIDRLMKGEDFSKLARKYSKRLWAAVKGGDMGFHTNEEYGALGDQIFKAKMGSVIGPVPVDSGYSIINVIEKREGKEKNFEEAKYDIADELLSAWRDIAFANALQIMQKKANVAIDQEKLTKLPFIDPVLLAQGE